MIRKINIYVLLNILDKMKEMKLKKLKFVFLLRFSAQVIDVDCSLVRLEFRNSLFSAQSKKMPQAQTYSIWLFRGSFSLLPMYDCLINRINVAEVNNTQLAQYDQYVKDKRNNRIEIVNKNLSLFASSIFPKWAPKYKNNLPNKPKNPLPIINQIPIIPNNQYQILRYNMF